MTVTLGEFGTIEIGHKTKFGKAKDVMAIYNLIAEQKGLRSLTLEDALRSKAFWQYVLATDTLLKNKELSNSGVTPELELLSNSNSAATADNTAVTQDLELLSNFKELDCYVDSAERMKFSDLIPKFPHLIQTKRGRYGGTWMHLNLLLKLASLLDPDLEALIYDAFVTGNILEYRDESGDEYKALCKSMDEKGLMSDTWDYAKVGQAIAYCVLGTKQKGCWNDATEKQLEERKTLEKYLTQAISDEFITDIAGIMKTIEKRK